MHQVGRRQGQGSGDRSFRPTCSTREGLISEVGRVSGTGAIPMYILAARTRRQVGCDERDSTRWLMNRGAPRYLLSAQIARSLS